MYQITNDRYDYVKEQLTQSYRNSQQFQIISKVQQVKSSFGLKKSDENKVDECVMRSQNYDNNTLTGSQKSSRYRKRLQVARVLISSIQSITEIEDNYSCYLNEKHNIMIIQKWFRRYICLKRYKKRIKIARMRRSVFFEVFSNEQRYVNDLEIIVNYVLMKIRYLHLLKEEDIQQLFLNIESILQLNYKFFKQLQFIRNNYEFNLKFSKNIKLFVPFFKIYYDYCSRFQLNYVDQLKKNNLDFNTFITTIEEEQQKLRGLSFESFLIKPVQQLPRYSLLFQQLLKFTESDHQDYEGISEITQGFTNLNKQMDLMMNTTKLNLKLLATYGTTNESEIQCIQERKKEEDEIIWALQSNVHIQVISTFIQKDGLGQFTIYIIEITAKSYRFRTFQRFSDLLYLHEQIITKYPDMINSRINELSLQELIQHNTFSTTTKVFLNIFSESVIKQRSIDIQHYLMALFKHPKLRLIQDLMIDCLDLPDNFFDINMNHKVLTHETDEIPCRDSYLNMKSSQMIKFSRNTYNFTRNSIQVNIFFPVQVILTDGRIINVEIAKTCRCLDLIETVAKSIRLDSYLDFKLLVFIDYKSRIVDDNEVIFKIIKNYNNLHQEPGKISKLLHKVTEFFTNVQNPTFHLRKCLFLSQTQEIQDFISDTTRLKLLVSQTWNDICENQFGLQIQDYCQYTAYYLLIKYYQLQLKIHSPSSMPITQISEIIPSKILRSQKKQLWKAQIYEHLLQTRNQVAQYKIKNDFEDQEAAQILFLQQISKLDLYGVQLFRAKVGDHSIQQLPKSVVIGISYKYLQIFNQQMVLQSQIQLIDIEQIVYKENCLNLEVRRECILKLKSKNIFEVYGLLEEYKQIQILQRNIQNSEENSQR